MKHQIFIEIDKFDNWAKNQSDIPQDSRGGEWECDYQAWNPIYDSFDDFIENSEPSNWSDLQKERLLYIIARDNELEIIVNSLSKHEDCLLSLINESILNGSRDDKWQLAKRTKELSDKKLAEELLMRFIEDEDEYVIRCSLMTLADINSNLVESYCENLWNKNKYGELEEYQRIAILHALRKVGSNQLDKYLDLAYKDGREYLVKNAREIENND